MSNHIIRRTTFQNNNGEIEIESNLNTNLITVRITDKYTGRTARIDLKDVDWKNIKEQS